MGVVAERVELYHGIKGPERRSYFRAFVFIFGSLPAFIKAMASREIEYRIASPWASSFPTFF